LEQDAVDAPMSPGERRRLRTAKSRGPDPPTLGSNLQMGDVGPSARHAGICG